LGNSPENDFAVSGYWQRLGGPEQPTEWELMLKSLELSEDQALLELESSGAKARKLRRWIEQNYRQRYIPSQFLTRRQLERFQWESSRRSDRNQ
jgi:hypothetical protein